MVPPDHLYLDHLCCDRAKGTIPSVTETDEGTVHGNQGILRERVTQPENIGNGTCNLSQLFGEVASSSRTLWMKVPASR